MGTRGLTVVRLDGKLKVAQYGQWDHYPTGQGDRICGYFREKGFLNRFVMNLMMCRFATKKEMEDFNNRLSDTGNEMIGQMFARSVYSRDCGSRVIKEISEFCQGYVLVNSIDFWEDTLYCEWVHELDISTKIVKDRDGFDKMEVMGCTYNIYHGKEKVGTFNMLEKIPTVDDLFKIERRGE